jgi:hypothetical protein
MYRKHIIQSIPPQFASSWLLASRSAPESDFLVSGATAGLQIFSSCAQKGAAKYLSPEPRAQEAQTMTMVMPTLMIFF